MEAATLAEAIHTVASTAASWPALAPGEAVTDTAPNFGVQNSHSQISPVKTKLGSSWPFHAH